MKSDYKYVLLGSKIVISEPTVAWVNYNYTVTSEVAPRTVQSKYWYNYVIFSLYRLHPKHRILSTKHWMNQRLRRPLPQLHPLRTTRKWPMPCPVAGRLRQ